MRTSLLVFFISISTTLAAQTGSWNILNVKVALNEKWNCFGEGQVRSLKFYDDFHYYELKGGITYKFSKASTLSAGFGIFDTYLPGGNFKTPMVNDEFRTWLQVSINHHEKRLKLEHRYRAEQRWTSNGFRNRFRYRLHGILPLNKRKVEAKTFYLVASDEIFLTSRAPFFERNRVFIGGGYEFSQLLALQIGYLHQFDYRLMDETGRGFFQISFLFELDWKKQSSEKTPGGMD